MKEEKSMLEEANEKGAGWSFIDDGSGVTVTHMPARVKKALEESKKNKEKTGFKLTKTDMLAIETGDLAYITSKGSNLYDEDTYYKSVEYYRLGSAMGDPQATSNLGYCYLYGRDIKADTELAIAYFTIAANQGNIDALYKLGDIFGSNKWKVKDKEKSAYYYQKAAIVLLEKKFHPEACIVWEYYVRNYPSLCFALARELLPDGGLFTDIELSYQFLKHAEIGYKKAIEFGSTMYEESYKNVLKCLNKKEYNSIRKKYDDLFSESDEDEYED